MRSPRTLCLRNARAGVGDKPGGERSAGGGVYQPACAPRISASRRSSTASLDDDAWSAAPLKTGEWKSYNPLHGDTVPQQTTVWVGYDKDALYFAFRCDDPEPGRIKTSITRRDNIWSDDWVGLSLDALGTGQTSYHLLVNPSGIQLDMINTLAGNEDTSPDWIWDSAGRVDDKGYTVEIRLPLQTIRFGGGADVQMGILFWRRISRTGVSVSWPALEPGSWVFQKHSRLGVLEPRAAADARADSVGRVHAQPGAGRAGRVGEAPTPTAISASARNGGSSSDDHARRHRQSRLQPGRERRLPGGSQSAVPDLLLREAPVLHGRRRAVQPRRQRAGRRVDALRRAHPADRRPDLRRQADRLVRPRHVRQPHRRRPVAGPDHRSARSPEWRREAVPGGARAGPAQYRQFRRRDGDVHRAGRPHQCRRGRRSQPALQGLEQPDGVRARLEHRRWRRRGAGHRAAGELRIQLATGQRVEPGRALRP